MTKPKEIIVFTVMLVMLGSAMGCASPTINENKNQASPASASNNSSVSDNANESSLTVNRTVTSQQEQKGNAISENINKSATINTSNEGLQRNVSSIKGEVSDVEGAIKDLGGQIVGNEIVIELPSDVLFDFDKHNIRSDAASALEKVLTIINGQKSDGSVRIEGHTDSIATDAYNQILSERRASSVKTWLVARGIAAARLRTRGFGESRPKVPNINPDGSDNSEGRQKNRRVEIFINKR